MTAEGVTLTEALRPLLGAHSDVTANHILASDWLRDHDAARLAAVEAELQQAMLDAGHDLEQAWARAETAEQQLVDLRASITTLVETERPTIGYGERGYVRADRVRALLADPAPSLDAVRAQAKAEALREFEPKCPRHGDVCNANNSDCRNVEYLRNQLHEAARVIEATS